MPAIPVAMMLEPMTFCFGATMAVRRDVLDAIGGLAALGGGIADDFTLGKLVSDAGYRVALCPYVVRMTVADRNLYELWTHHLRWQRTVLSVRPVGFSGTILTHVLPTAALAAVLCPSKSIGGLIIGSAAALRVMVHDEAARTFAPEIALSPWLIPAADALAFATWAAAFFAKGVTWRGQQFTVEMGGGFG
jgi:ceramide glucosyltransferase